MILSLLHPVRGCCCVGLSAGFDGGNLRFHLHNQPLQLILALLSGFSVDLPGVLLSIEPHGGIPSLKQVVVDLADAAGAGLSPCAHTRFESGHSGLFRLR